MNRLVSVSVLTLAVLATGAGRANCIIPSATATIASQEGQPVFKVELRNDSVSSIYLPAGSLDPRSFTFVGKPKSGKRSLRRVVPMNGVVVEPIHLPPGETRSWEMPLQFVFPDLRSALREGPLTVNWEIEVAPIDQECRARFSGSFFVPQILKS